MRATDSPGSHFNGRCKEWRDLLAELARELAGESDREAVLTESCTPRSPRSMVPKRAWSDSATKAIGAIQIASAARDRCSLTCRKREPTLAGTAMIRVEPSDRRC